METKRRLFYLPDDEVTIDELTDSPRPRPSRMSRLLIPPSSDEENEGKERSREAEASLEQNCIDHDLLVSYGSYIMADGSGAFRPPPTQAEAAALHASLRHCCRVLREFMRDHSWCEPSTDLASASESSDSRSSLMSIESEEYSQSDSNSDSLRRGRRKLQRKQNRQTKSQKESLDGCDFKYKSLTVLDLREQLRKRNLPISGTKKILLFRLQNDDKRQELKAQETYPRKESTSHEGASPIEPIEHSDCPLECENECTSKTVWGTLMDMGSRFFRRSSTLLTSTELDRKRRRSA